MTQENLHHFIHFIWKCENVEGWDSNSDTIPFVQMSSSQWPIDCDDFADTQNNTQQIAIDLLLDFESETSAVNCAKF